MNNSVLDIIGHVNFSYRKKKLDLLASMIIGSFRKQDCPTQIPGYTDKGACPYLRFGTPDLTSIELRPTSCFKLGVNIDNCSTNPQLQHCQGKNSKWL